MPPFLHLLVFFLSASAAPPDDAGPPQESLYLQEEEPVLIQRAISAKARVEAADSFFRGETGIPQAWPELQGSPLNSESYLRSQLHLLQAGAEARAEDRRTGGEGLPQDLSERRRKALSEALLLEEREDEGKRRLLTALLVGLKAHPGLEASALDPHFSALSSQRSGLDPEKEEDLALAASIFGQEERLRRLVDAALQSLAQNSPSALSRFIEEEMEFSPAGMTSTERREQRRRLSLATPLLGEEMAARAGPRISLLDKLLQSEELRSLKAELDGLVALGDYPAGHDWKAEKEALPAKRGEHEAEQEEEGQGGREKVPAEGTCAGRLRVAPGFLRFVLIDQR